MGFFLNFHLEEINEWSKINIFVIRLEKLIGLSRDILYINVNKGGL